MEGGISSFASDMRVLVNNREMRFVAKFTIKLWIIVCPSNALDIFSTYREILLAIGYNSFE